MKGPYIMSNLIYNLSNKKNSSKNKKETFTSILSMFLILTLIFTFVLTIIFFTGGCKKKVQELPEEVISAETATEQATEKSTESIAESASESASESATESTEEIPEEILEFIEKADKYYLNGDYGLARSTYRKAEIAINNSELSDDTKQELIDSFYLKYKKSKDIVDSASMHYGNAMQLIYETRYEEAKKELESALALYPKYAEAIEAYENLKVLMGLQ